MFYSVTLVAVILLSSWRSCAANALNETAPNNASFSEVLSSAMNSKGNYSDYLSLLKEKCETHHHLLSSYEQQCCMKIAHAKEHMPFSIIRQNTDIMQFTNDIDHSLFKILLNHFSNDVTHTEASAASIMPRTVSLTSENDLKQCLVDKAACLEELAGSSHISQDNVKLTEKVNTLQSVIERQTTVHAELENEVRILREQREADRNEVDKLTKELESAIQRLMREEENTMNVISEREKCKSELGAVDNSLSKCQLHLVEAKQELAKEQNSLATCSAELANLQSVQAAVVVMEEHIGTLRKENVQLQEELDQSRKAIEDKDGQLAKCAEFESLFIMCDQRLGHCHNSSSETEEELQDKYDQCSTNLNISVATLHRTREENNVLHNDIDRLTEASVSCQGNLTIQEKENELLLAEKSQQEERITAMMSNIEGLSTSIISFEEQLEECSNYKERTEVSLLSIKNDLSLQLESYNRLELRYHEQSNKTLAAHTEKHNCLIQLEEIEADSRKCTQHLEAARAEVSTITKVAEQCVASHRDCNLKLELASLQIQNCSSSAELASWKTLHEECRAENIKCESSKTELTIQVNEHADIIASHEEKLSILRAEEARCQTANSELRSSLNALSDTHGALVARVDELSAKETSCQQQLTEAKEGWMSCQNTVMFLEVVRDEYLAEVKQQVERVGALEESSAELNTALQALSSRHETCQQERHSAFAHVSSLNATLESCRRTVDELNTDVTGLETELNKCLSSRNLTHANLTEWQARHDRCVQNVAASESRYVTLTEQCDAWRELNDQLQGRLTVCEGQLTALQTQRQTLLIEVEHWRVSSGLANQTAAECAARLEQKTTEVLQSLAEEQATARLLQQCTAALHACQNPPPPPPCPATEGNNTYHGVDLTVGRDNVVSAEELAGCYMASHDSAFGRPMKHFCHSQQGHLFKIPDEKAMEFVGQIVKSHEGKFLVDPSAYFISSLGLDLKQYASGEEICYYVEGATASAPQLKHDRCAGLEFHAICWTSYQSGYEYVITVPEGADTARDPDYLDYSSVDDTVSEGADTARDPDYLDYGSVDEPAKDPDYLDYAVASL